MEELRITMEAARVNAGLFQQEAATLIGVSRATLQNYESGKTVPTWETAKKIAQAYNFPMEHIFFGRKDA